MRRPLRRVVSPRPAVVGGIALFLMFGLSPASGLGETALSVSPARVRATLEPGEWLPPVQVRNPGTEPLDVSVSWAWGGHDLAGGLVIETAAPAAEVGLALEPTRLRLAPAEAAPVRARLLAPVGFSGAIYPVILFSFGSTAGTHAAPRQTQLAVPVLLWVGGLAPADLRLAGVSIRPGDEPGAWVLEAVVRNEGARDALVQPQLRLYDGGGRSVREFVLQQARVLPGLARRWEVAWEPGDLPVGEYRVVAALPGAGADGAVATARFGILAGGDLAALPEPGGGGRRVATGPGGSVQAP